MWYVVGRTISGGFSKKCGEFNNSYINSHTLIVESTVIVDPTICQNPLSERKPCRSFHIKARAQEWL